MYKFLYKNVISKLPDRWVESFGGIFMGLLSYLTRYKETFSFEISGVKFSAPVGISSGWVDSPKKYHTMRRFGTGVIVLKTVTPLPKKGNPYPQLVRGSGYLINSMGLPNKGCAWWSEYNKVNQLPSPVIMSIKGESIEEWKRLIKKNEFWVDVFELNFSCPNVKSGIMDIGESENIIRTISKFTDLPLLLKLSPEYSPADNLDLVKRVRSYISGVSLINTVPVTEEKLGNPRKIGGKSGRAIYPVLLTHLATFRKEYPSFSSLPILASGGITVETCLDILTVYKSIPMMLTTFLTEDPYCHSNALKEIDKFLARENLTLEDLLT